MTEYKAFNDTASQYVSAKAKRRCVVVKYHNGKYCYLVGMFSSMAAAQKRADELNKDEAGAAGGA
jgi:hypothetical protein